MWRKHLAFLRFIVCRIFLSCLTLGNISSFLTRSVRLIFSILLQHHKLKTSRYFCSTFRSVQVILQMQHFLFLKCNSSLLVKRGFLHASPYHFPLESVSVWSKFHGHRSSASLWRKGRVLHFPKFVLILFLVFKFFPYFLFLFQIQTDLSQVHYQVYSQNFF
jgi:hypothetical protein